MVEEFYHWKTTTTSSTTNQNRIIPPAPTVTIPPDCCIVVPPAPPQPALPQPVLNPTGTPPTLGTTVTPTGAWVAADATLVVLGGEGALAVVTTGTEGVLTEPLVKVLMVVEELLVLLVAVAGAFLWFALGFGLDCVAGVPLDDVC